MSGWLEPVRSALDAASEPVTFFFRDDDAGWRDDRLFALADLFARHALPLDLAVIPEQLDRPLARVLRRRAEAGSTPLGFHQHGFAHVNHEPTGRKCEFGPSRSPADQRRDVEAGRRRMRALLGDLVAPIFTPPWNRCTEVTAACLAELDFSALSRESRAAPLEVAGLGELPVHVDWFAHRKGTRLTPRALAELIAREVAKAGPVGIMFHHAVMDRHERCRAGELLALLAGHERARSRPMPALLAERRWE